VVARFRETWLCVKVDDFVVEVPFDVQRKCGIADGVATECSECSSLDFVVLRRFRDASVFSDDESAVGFLLTKFVLRVANVLPLVGELSVLDDEITWKMKNSSYSKKTSSWRLNSPDS
jgi:hypothetical protein